MGIAQLISQDRIEIAENVTSKKRSLEKMSHLLVAEDSPLTPADVFDGLLMRERLGSTGLGKGIAIPHARVGGCDAATGAILKLNSGVDFDAVDQDPVDVFFGLIVPEECTNEHLALLAELAELFSNADFCTKLRATEDADAIYQLFQDALAS